MPASLPPIVIEIETRGAAGRGLGGPDGPRAGRRVVHRSLAGRRRRTAYRLDFGDGSVVNGVVTELEPGRRFAHTWAWADAEPGEETVVSWSVEALPGGGPRSPWSTTAGRAAGLDTTARDDHEGYWIGYLEDLAAVLQGDG